MRDREIPERERSGEGPRRRKRKKKKSHRLYAFVVLVFGIAIIAVAFMLLFYVQKIEVSGNEYTAEDEIIEAVKDDRLSMNSLYILGKYALGKGTVIPCLDQMKVRMKNPWTLKVEVREKPIVGYIQNGEKYGYFDKEGLVVCESSSLMEGLPYIEGIEVGEIRLYRHLKSGDTGIFEQILETSKEVTKYELVTDRIVCEEDNICLYVGNVRICLGESVSSAQIAQIEPILEKLGNQEGTLHLEHYTEMSKTITFEAGPVSEELQLELEADPQEPSEEPGETG